MKKFSRVLALLLVLVMAFSLAACSADDKASPNTTAAPETKAPDTQPANTEALAPQETKAPATETPATEAPETEPPATEAPETEKPGTEASLPERDDSPIYGVYEGELDLDKMMELSAGELSEDDAALYGKLFDGCDPIKIFMEFSNGQRIHLGLDKDSFGGIMETMLKNLPEVLAEMFGMSMEELEELLQAQDMTMDDFMTMMAEEMNPEELFAAGEMDMTGTYRLDGETLYITPDNDDQEITRMRVLVDDEILIIIEIHSGEEDEEVPEQLLSLLPWIFVKTSDTPRPIPEPEPTEAEEPTESVEPTESEEPTEPEEPTVFEEVTAIDNEYCLVKITGMEEDDLWGGTALNVYLENRTADKTLTFTVENVSVNGVSWTPLFAAEVAAGEKTNDEISFFDDELEALLPEFTDVELVLRVYDSDDWSADDYVRETVHVYPFGIDKATVYVREPQDTDTVIVDNDQFSVIVTGYDPDSFWGYAAKLYLVNKSDKNLSFTCDDVSVNGFMCEPYWSETLGPGKSAFSDVDWADSTFEENGIEDVEEIKMTFRVYDDDDWFADDIYNETIVLKP